MPKGRQYIPTVSANPYIYPTYNLYAYVYKNICGYTCARITKKTNQKP